MFEDELKKLIELTYELKSKKEALENAKKVLEEQIKGYETAIETNTNSVIQALNEKKEVQVTYDDLQLVAFTAFKESKGYNEPEVIKYLKEKGLNQYIKVEEKLKKQELNKILKTDLTLNESLKPMYEVKNTQYAVITTCENYKKMQEHINKE